MGNFNTDLLSFDTAQDINEFIDNSTLSSLQPQILQPTRRYKNHKTLIDDIFCNIPNFETKIQYVAVSQQLHQITFHSFF